MEGGFRCRSPPMPIQKVYNNTPSRSARAVWCTISLKSFDLGAAAAPADQLLLPHSEILYALVTDVTTGSGQCRDISLPRESSTKRGGARVRVLKWSRRQEKRRAIRQKPIGIESDFEPVTSIDRGSNTTWLSRHARSVSSGREHGCSIVRRPDHVD